MGKYQANPQRAMPHTAEALAAAYRDEGFDGVAALLAKYESDHATCQLEGMIEQLGKGECYMSDVREALTKAQAARSAYIKAIK